MSFQDLNYVIALVLLLQGLSHGKTTWDLVSMLRDWDEISTPTIRIRLAPKLSPKASVLIVCVFWLLAAAGFVVAAMGLSGVLELGTAWRPLAGMAAFISIVGIALNGGRWPERADQQAVECGYDHRLGDRCCGYSLAGDGRLTPCSQDGSERFWRNLLCESASDRFHRPTAGLSLSKVAQGCIRAARSVEAIVSFCELQPHMELLADRMENSV